MSTTTSVTVLKINKYTSAQYEGITPSDAELYFVTDDPGITSADVTTALGYIPYNSSNPNGYIDSSALASYELIAKDMTALAASGTIALSDNNVYKISATGTVTFTLPTITDATKFHQILVQLYMASVQTINLSTTYYFNGTAPDMTEAGYYTIIYEYDNIHSVWVVGALKKASAS
jgi:hypothetical protein